MNKELLYLYLCLCCMYFLHGAFIACVGPLIPLFSYQTGHHETSYSYLFMIITSANIMGCFGTKWMVGRYPLSNIFSGMMLIAIVGLLVLFSDWSDVCLSVGFFIVNAANMVNNITITTVIFKYYTKEKPAMLMMIIGFLFGAGTMLGPGLVIIFERYFFLLNVVFNVAILVAFHFATFPGDSQEQQKGQQPKRQLSRRSELLICGLFCVYIVEELGLASWLPTYAIKMGVAESHSAGTYSFLFWIVNCLSRLVWMWFSKSITNLIKIALLLTVGSTFICLLLQYQGYYWFLCVFAAVSSGFILANLYCFFLSLPHDNGIESTPQNTANFVLGTTFGEGIFITSIGYGMEYLGPQFLFMVEFIFALVAFGLFKQTLASFKPQKPTKASPLECELLEITH